jgi:hypothetical protein
VRVGNSDALSPHSDAAAQQVFVPLGTRKWWDPFGSLPGKIQILVLAFMMPFFWHDRHGRNTVRWERKQVHIMAYVPVCRRNQ